VRRTKLILVEGLPGAGKSTTAQFLARQLARRGIAARWWYEEELGHPVYLFRDRASLRQVLDDLAAGRRRRVVADALRHWRRFVAEARRSDPIALLDGCLFGYLTWTLFHFDAPEPEIAAYVERVAEIIRPLDPCLVVLRQPDVAGAMARLCARRGEATARGYIERAAGSPYGERRGLSGFDGLVAFWEAYRQIADAVLARLDLAKRVIEEADGDWPARQRAILAFLGLPPAAEEPIAPADLARCVGDYIAVEPADGRACRVWLAGDALLIDGLPEVWPATPLLPRSPGRFAVESLPFEVEFDGDAAGVVTRLTARGPDLLGGAVGGVYAKMPAARSMPGAASSDGPTIGGARRGGSPCEMCSSASGSR
jgi:thymidylate kinase